MTSRVDWTSEREVLSFAKRITERNNSQMQEYYRKWYMQTAYYAGLQNLRWNNYSNILEEPHSPAWRVRMVCNLIQPSVRTMVAKLIKVKPWLDVTPATGDLSDAVIATKGKRVLQFYWDYLGMMTKYIECLFWAGTTGNGFLKVGWDPEAGEFLDVSPSDLLSNQDLADEDRKALLKLFKKQFNIEGPVKENKVYTVPIGDPFVEVITPFEIIVPQNCKNLDDAPWVMQLSIKHIEELHDRYGSAAERIQQGDLSEGQLSTFYQSRLSSLERVNAPINEYKDHVLVREVWHRPSRSLPRGARYVICQDEILNEHRENPYRHQRLPYIHIREIFVPGKFWGTCATEQLMDIQKDYNKTRSQLVEHKDTMLAGKWLVPVGSGVKDGTITNEPFQVIRYNYPFKPEQADIKPLPASMDRLLGFHRQDLEDITGQHEVSKAQVPGEVRSGAAISLLQEADDTKLNVISVTADRELTKLGSMLLDVIAQYVKEERLASVVGDENYYQSFFFRGSDLVGANLGTPNVSYFRVNIQTFSRLPMNRQAQQEMITYFLDKGIFDPIKDKNLILHMSSIGSVAESMKPSRNAKAKALYENQLMTQGQPVQAQFWELHDAHIEALMEFMNSHDFEMLDQSIQQLFTSHLTQHFELQAAVQVYPQVQLAKQSLIAKAAAMSTLPPQVAMFNAQQTQGQSQTQGQKQIQ